MCTREDDLLVSRFQGPDGLQGFQGRWQLYDMVASARLSLEDSAHPSTGFFFPFFLPRFYPSSPVCVCRRRKRGRLVQGFSVYCILRYGSPRKRLWPGAYYSMLAVSSGALRVAADISGRTETGLKSCVEVETST